MDSVELIRRLHQHRAWVNRKLIAAAAQLSEEQLQQTFEIGQGSVWKSLTHLFAAEYVWLEALLGNEDPLTPGDVPGKLPGNQEGADAASSLAELQTRWDELAGRWQRFLADLTEETLDQVVYKISTSSAYGRRQGTRCGDVLLHVCTHAQYTSAQCVNQLRRLGKTELPDVMLITLARQATADHG